MSEIAYSNELHAKYRERTVSAAEAVADLLLSVLPPVRSVVDIGCGHGHWLAALLRHGVPQVLGLDGAYIDPAQLVIPREAFRPVQLDGPVEAPGRYDLAMSLEVAEHLPAVAGDRLVQVLCTAAPVVLFSAAIPGQAGDHHINTRTHRYWREQFAAEGFAAFDFIRPALWHREDINLCYRQNILVYAREASLKESSYAKLAAQPRANCLTLIDEDILALQSTARAVVKRILRRGDG
jgi:SAM-dependent methyltransferase